jgi:predicted permease
MDGRTDNMDMESSSDSLSLVLRATAEADLSIVLLVLLGSYFAFKGVFDSKGVSDMGKLVYHISLPCLLFSKILYEFSIERMKILWVLMFACLVHVLSAYVLAELSGRLLWISKVERKVATASMMFGNWGRSPLRLSIPSATRRVWWT